MQVGCIIQDNVLAVCYVKDYFENYKRNFLDKNIKNTT